jgi:hypothetical protein
MVRYRRRRVRDAYLIMSTSSNCCCAPPASNICINALGCPTGDVYGRAGHAIVAGATITITYDGTTYTSTVGVSSFCAYIVAAVGFPSYTWSVTATNYTSQSGTAAFPSSFSVTLIPAPGYTCANCCCTDTGTAPYAIVTMPTTVFVNDSLGTITCSPSGGIAPGCVLWTGTAQRLWGGVNCAGTPGGTPYLVDVTFVVGCDGDVTVSYPANFPNGPPVPSGTSGTTTVALSTGFPGTPACAGFTVAYSTSASQAFTIFTVNPGYRFSFIYGCVETAPGSGTYITTIPLTITP